MNYPIFLGVLNFILIARLRLISRDNGINRKDILIISVIPLVSLLFLTVSLGWYLLAIYLISHPALLWLSEKNTERLNKNRLMLLFLHLLTVGMLCSPLFQLSSNSLAAGTLGSIDQFLFSETSLTTGAVNTVQLFLFGLLMILNEANIMLRYLLKIMGLKSLGKSTEVDQKEYNTGRVIGLLERIFVFLFVLLNQYTAIGFILAAKGVARFKDFESRTFAEYVLVGTLLSALLAMSVGYLVKWGIGI